MTSAREAADELVCRVGRYEGCSYCHGILIAKAQKLKLCRVHELDGRYLE